MPEPLFRTDALAHRANRFHGVVLLARPVSFSLLTALFMVVAAAIVAFFAFGTYVRRIEVQGTLVLSNGVIKVTPVQPGLVVEARVAEGQAVQAGDVLFVLSGEHQTANQRSAEQTISELLNERRESLRQEQAQLKQQLMQRLDAAHHRSQDMAAEVRRINDQAELQLRRIAMSRSMLSRYTELAASNFVSPVQVQDKQADLLEQEQRLAELRRAAAAASRDLVTAEAEARDLGIQSQRDLEAGQRATINTEQDIAENEAHRQVLLRAPSSGTVTAITAQVGQTVASGQPLASLLPADSRLEAELYAPSRAVGFLTQGMAVQLRYQAYAFQKFGQATGRVREISKTSLRPDELSIPSAPQSGEPVYRVRVALDRQTLTAYGKEQVLRSGEALDASVMLERRRLYEWVLEPLFTVSGRL